MFQVDQLKSKQFVVSHKNYKFKEDWLIQAVLLEKSKALDWIDYLDINFPETVRVTREYYTCNIKRVFEGPSGFKLEFKDKTSATKYCDILNKKIVERRG